MGESSRQRCLALAHLKAHVFGRKNEDISIEKANKLCQHVY
jgi:hypothetical protein